MNYWPLHYFDLFDILRIFQGLSNEKYNKVAGSSWIIQKVGGSSPVEVDSGLCPCTVLALQCDELSSISVSVSAVKVGQFKRRSWVHLNALKSCGGLLITGIEDGETILLGHLLFFLFGQSTLAAHFRKQFLRLYCGVELCLILSRRKLGKASFEIVLADPELVQMQVETWDLVQQVAVRAGGSGTAQKAGWDLLCVSAFSSTPGGATLLFLEKNT